jgi:hypothetical protein
VRCAYALGRQHEEEARRQHEAEARREQADDKVMFAAALEDLIARGIFRRHEDDKLELTLEGVVLAEQYMAARKKDGAS